jgi:hypothetical protein
MQNGFRGGAYYPGESGKYYLPRCPLKRPLSDRPSDVESCEEPDTGRAPGTIKVSSVRPLFRGQQRPSSHCHCVEGPMFLNKRLGLKLPQLAGPLLGAQRPNPRPLLAGCSRMARALNPRRMAPQSPVPVALPVAPRVCEDGVRDVQGSSF